jgi:hypothetical protein
VSDERPFEAIPLTVVIADGVDLETADPALVTDGFDQGRRLCIAERRAGGRCQAGAPADSLLCNAHSGRLDSSAGGHARAESLRAQRREAEQDAAAGRLGTRGLIARVFVEESQQLGKALRTLIAMAADGDRDAAKALIPYLNQGLGMPTERVEMQQPGSVSDLAAMGTDELRQYVARRRAAGTAAAETA